METTSLTTDRLHRGYDIFQCGHATEREPTGCAKQQLDKYVLGSCGTVEGCHDAYIKQFTQPSQSDHD